MMTLRAFSELRKVFARHSASREWALYKKTGKDEHAWMAYRKWREMAPDAPLPPALMQFLDSCAERSAGTSNGHADARRHQRDAVERYVHRLEMAKARAKEQREGLPRGYKTKLQKEEAARAGLSFSQFKVLLHDWKVTTQNG